MQGPMQLRLTRALHNDGAVLDGDAHLRIQVAAELGFAARHHDGMVGNGDCHAAGDLDRKPANPTHGSPNVAHDLAAEAGPGCLLTGHHAVRGRQYNDPQPAEHPWKLSLTGIHSQPRVADPQKAAERPAARPLRPSWRVVLLPPLSSGYSI